MSIETGHKASITLTPGNALGTVRYTANYNWVTFNGNTATFAPVSADTYTVIITAADSGRTSNNTAQAAVRVTAHNPSSHSGGCDSGIASLMLVAVLAITYRKH